MAARTDTARRVQAQAVLDEWDLNEWAGSDSLDELAEHRYAVVIMREDDSWVTGVDSAEGVAGVILGTYDAEYTREWVGHVIDLNTGGEITWQTETVVSVTLEDGDRGRAVAA